MQLAKMYMAGLLEKIRANEGAWSRYDTEFIEYINLLFKSMDPAYRHLGAVWARKYNELQEELL